MVWLCVVVFGLRIGRLEVLVVVRLELSSVVKIGILSVPEVCSMLAAGRDD